MIIENYLHFHKIQWKCGDASFDFGSNPDHITLGFLGLGLGGGGTAILRMGGYVLASVRLIIIYDNNRQP